MKRNLILGLLLANLLVLAWAQWIVPPDVEDPEVYRGASEPELQVVARAPARPARLEKASTANTPACARLGPFESAGAARQIGNRLSAEGLPVKNTTVTGQLWVGHWVQMTDVASTAEAARIVTALNNGGIQDAYIYNRDPTIDISLGVFRSREGADDVIRTARRLGYEVESADRFRDGVEYWVETELPVVGAPDLAALARSGTGPGQAQIVRIEPISCPSTVLAESREDGTVSVDSLESPPRATGTPE